MITTAGFGPGGNKSIYRYTLRRDWNDELEPGHKRRGEALFIMLNPSTADAVRNDPTVAKCLRLARRWGYEAMEVRNIFALRSTDPQGLRRVDDPVGPENDAAILECAARRETRLIVAAWGNHGLLVERGAQMTQMLRRLRRPVHAFSITKQQMPAHPLYQKECLVDGLVRYL
jgi:hypothetical protein